MADKQREKALRLQRRKWSVRNSLAGTAERPRLSVFRSDKHIYAQVIDDLAGRTLVSASSTLTDVRGDLKNGGNVAAAKVVGKAIAQRAKAARITQGAVDRGGRQDHRPAEAPAPAPPGGGVEVLTDFPPP